MSAADHAQRKHNVPHALITRFNTLIEGNRDWHEWHQTGVLLFQLALSTDAQLKQDEPKTSILLMLDYVEWLYSVAHTRVPQDNPLATHAIKCDKELAQFYKRFIERHYANHQQFVEFRRTVQALETLPPSLDQQHQLAIAYGFMARCAWLMQRRDPLHPQLEGWAFEWENFAEQWFRRSRSHPDKQQAHRSHKLAMALARAELGRYGWRGYAWSALWNALWHRDYKHAVRAGMIIMYGTEGERRLRARRDTADVYREAVRLMYALRPEPRF